MGVKDYTGRTTKIKTMKMNLGCEVKIPTRPNYILFSKGENGVPIDTMTDEELREIGTAWIEALISEAREKRALPNRTGGKQ